MEKDTHPLIRSLAANPQQEAQLNAITSELFRVSPRIGLLNQYMRKVQDVAISGMDPIYTETHQLQGFNVRAEGPALQLKHLRRMLSDDKLKVG